MSVKTKKKSPVDMVAGTLNSADLGKEALVGMLTDFISERSLRPGDRLPSIRELAEHFGVKSGVVRDALLDAQGKGVIKVLPRAGAFVVQASPGDDLPNLASPSQRMKLRLQELLSERDHNLLHLLSVREVLELELASSAARRCEVQDLFALRKALEGMSSMPLEDRPQRYTQLDVDFHLEIARLSGNDVMGAMLGVVLEELMTLMQDLTWSKSRSIQTDESHAKIYSALVAGDAEGAKSEIRSHLQVAYQALLEQLRVPPETLS